MGTNRHVVRGWILAVTALAWAGLGLFWAQVILLPNPFLPPLSLVELLGDVPPTTRPQRFVVMLLRETSLLLCGFALLGLVPAALALRSGARLGPLIAAAMSAAAVAISLIPVAQAWSTASADDVPLSVAGYFAGFSPASDVRPQTETYARPGGEGLKLDVYEPSGGGPARRAEGRPAVVVVHGGGWRSGERSQFPRWDAWLAEKGYVVFDIEYRLSPPPSWREAPADVRCAVAWVKENAGRYDVDPDRVALWGRSAGGQLAMLAAYGAGDEQPPSGCGAQDTEVAAVAAFYSPTDLSRLDRLGYLSGMDRYLGGTPENVPERYRLSSPVEVVGPDDPPTLLVHGTADKIVPPGQSGLMARGLRAAGVRHRLVELPSANHTFDFVWGGWNSQIVRSSLGGFLETRLGPSGTHGASRTAENDARRLPGPPPQRGPRIRNKLAG